MHFSVCDLHWQLNPWNPVTHVHKYVCLLTVHVPWFKQGSAKQLFVSEKNSVLMKLVQVKIYMMWNSQKKKKKKNLLFFVLILSLMNDPLWNKLSCWKTNISKLLFVKVQQCTLYIHIKWLVSTFTYIDTQIHGIQKHMHSYTYFPLQYNFLDSDRAEANMHLNWCLDSKIYHLGRGLRKNVFALFEAIGRLQFAV